MARVQLKGRGIKDGRVLNAMEKVPRHRFVPAGLGREAYGDYPVPIGESQTISQPYMVALMTEHLRLKGGERVLEVGTGSGYQTAILAELAEEVYTVERIGTLSRRAEELIRELGYTNVAFRVGDGSGGWLENAPYDGIMVTAGAPRVPDVLIKQLNEGGRLVIPVGGSYSQDLTLVEKEGGKISERCISGCVFVPLIGKHGHKL